MSRPQTAMKVRFGQIYIQAGVTFPFSLRFQQRLSEELSALVMPSMKFSRRYGADWELMFRISAKRSILDNEICGPTIFKKQKEIEFTIFLPFDVIQNATYPSKSAIEFLLIAVSSVLDSLGFDIAPTQARMRILAQTFSTDPTMFDSK